MDGWLPKLAAQPVVAGGWRGSRRAFVVEKVTLGLGLAYKKAQGSASALSPSYKPKVTFQTRTLVGGPSALRTLRVLRDEMH